MQKNQTNEHIQTLNDIRSIMERSSRFLSLSGLSGVWAGIVALAGAVIAFGWLASTENMDTIISSHTSLSDFLHDSHIIKYLLLASAVFVVALIGSYLFTLKKVRSRGGTMWSSASRHLMFHIAVPIAAGSIFILALLYHGQVQLAAPACLIFYGLALVNGSKYTLPDIRVLGYLEIVLGCINLLLPSYSLLLWTVGFGILHIIYGIVMWRKYDTGFDE